MKGVNKVLHECITMRDRGRGGLGGGRESGLAEKSSKLSPSILHIYHNEWYIHYTGCVHSLKIGEFLFSSFLNIIITLGIFDFMAAIQ